MNNEVIEKVFEYIDVLAQKLGVATEFVFKTLIVQMFIEGIVWSLILIVLLIASIIIYKKVISFVTTVLNDIKEPLIFLSTFILLLIIIIVITYLPYNIMKIFNPEYYALKEILDVFKSD